MKKLNHLPLLAGVMVLAVLLMACAAALEPTPPTEVPTFTPEPPTPEPPTATPLPTPGKSSEVPRITVQELKERLDSGASIMILDTRSQRSFDQEHIAGALVKLDSYEAVPKEQEIVFYCSWPNESLSASSALRLYKDGFTNVSALLGGIAAWKEAGYPVEESS